MNKASKAKPPSRDLRTWVVYGSIAVLVLGVLVAVAYSSRTNVQPMTFPKPVKLNIGDKAPEFTAATTSGSFDLAKEAGKPVLLEVFATWCPHCQRETGTLNQLYDAYKEKVAFVSVSGNSIAMNGRDASSQEDVMQFVERFKVRYPVAYDPDLTVANKYMQNGYPTIVVIGKNGKIMAVSSGEATRDALQKSLDTALKAS